MYTIKDTIMAQEVKKLKSYHCTLGFYEHCKFNVQI